MDVAAMISTSGTVGVVTEAFSVLESRAQSVVSVFAASVDRMAWEAAIDGARGGASASLAPSRYRASVDAAALPAFGGHRFGAGPVAGVPGPHLGDPRPFIGPRPGQGRVATETLRELRGTALLDQLALLPRLDLEAFVSTHPEVVSAMVVNPPLAAETASWWSAATAADRGRLLDAAPTLVGNLEGIPFADRDAANRALLHETIGSLETRLASGRLGRAESDEVRARLHMLREVTEALRPGDSGLERTLITLDTTDGGRAAIGIGGIAEADYVTFVVPGMFFGVDTQLVAWTDMADALAEEQNDWLRRLHPASAADGDDRIPTAATVSWIGYETPTLLNVASMELARQGRDALTGALQGLDASRADRPFVSIFAHSYGSTAAMLALEQNQVSVDALAVMGSPGSPAKTAADLRVRGGNVWVGVAWWDPIPNSGVFGSQPASDEYGAGHFEVDAVDDPVTGERLTGALSHNDYFTPGSTSFRNLALIGIDRNDLVLLDADVAPVSRALAR